MSRGSGSGGNSRRPSSAYGPCQLQIPRGRVIIGGSRTCEAPEMLLESLIPGNAVILRRRRIWCY